MKSVVSSAWLITVAVGNVITIAVASVKFFDVRHSHHDDAAMITQESLF